MLLLKVMGLGLLYGMREFGVSLCIVVQVKAYKKCKYICLN